MGKGEEAGRGKEREGKTKPKHKTTRSTQRKRKKTHPKARDKQILFFQNQPGGADHGG